MKDGTDEFSRSIERKVLALVVGIVLVGMMVAFFTACTTTQDRNHPCWSDEYQRVLPPVLGDDC